jgi:hypothetical protein
LDVLVGVLFFCLVCFISWLVGSVTLGVGCGLLCLIWRCYFLSFVGVVLVVGFGVDCFGGFLVLVFGVVACSLLGCFWSLCVVCQLFGGFGLFVGVGGFCYGGLCGVVGCLLVVLWGLSLCVVLFFGCWVCAFLLVCCLFFVMCFGLFGCLCWWLVAFWWVGGGLLGLGCFFLWLGFLVLWLGLCFVF